MTRTIFVCLAILLSLGSARSETTNLSPTGIAAANGTGTNTTLTNPILAGIVNNTGTAGYQLGGQNGLSLSTATNEQNLLVGPFAGASAPGNGQFITAVAPYTFESLTAVAPESAAAGQGAGISLTTGGGMTTMGISSCASQTIVGATCFGDDAGRDAWDTGSFIALGPGAYGDGAGTGGVIAVGANTLWGAASTITFTGTGTVGDVKHFTVSSANACNGTSITINCTTGTPQTVNYTLVSGDTVPATLATHVAAALTAALTGAQIVNYTLGDGVQESTHNLFGMNFSVADATNHSNVIKGHYPSSWQTSLAYTCTGTCGDTVTIGTASAPANLVLVGNGIFGYFGVGTPTTSAIVGDNDFGLFAVNPTNLAVVGNNVGLNCGSAGGGGSCSNAALVGFNVAEAASSVSQDAILANYGGYGLTTGTKETILGDETASGSGCITSGSQNLEVGLGACVVSPTASYQMSIQNAIYGLSNSGTGSTLSAGCIGFYTTTCTGTSAVDFGGPVLMGALTSDTGESDATVCDVTASGTLYYGSGTGGICLTTSTARFKDHIEDAVAGFSGGLHVLRELFALRTVQFNYKPGYGFDPKHRYWGWTAEQMQTVFPELVGHDSEGKPNSVDMMGMLPRVVAAVQAGEYLVLGMLAGMIALTFYCVGLHAYAMTLRRRVAAIEAVMRAAQ